ncbi:hypothetical protein VTJ04DRAFT_6430 [Mycothermus thermophilus]|uniref:uncharacterized protein n=1 Tax=Humicola insolens TaxID=85995 RepID=UPI0037435DF8
MPLWGFCFRQRPRSPLGQLRQPDPKPKPDISTQDNAVVGPVGSPGILVSLSTSWQIYALQQLSLTRAPDNPPSTKSMSLPGHQT